ncbi:hypothetical protein H072_4838 [Dactylellina haptotyla CBS 200.50]|uniref:Uncharacterized protein n=1 Tax=Dactylellina haptotyla (strain CBS 200.50) TaxID=1284197 RepID=S8AE57_DACHA|nr:hypothetical protein H072_4838 [Dactylellina haptotyla CBS 200.50]
MRLTPTLLAIYNLLLLLVLFTRHSSSEPIPKCFSDEQPWTPHAGLQTPCISSNNFKLRDPTAIPVEQFGIPTTTNAKWYKLGEARPFIGKLYKSYLQRRLEWSRISVQGRPNHIPIRGIGWRENVDTNRYNGDWSWHDDDDDI